jgi:hypothetical protein
MVVAMMIIVGLALGLETVGTSVERAMSTTWRLVGDRLANRELYAMAQQLDRERKDSECMRAVRDTLSARLKSLEAFRECVATQVEERCQLPGADSQHELVSLDTVIGQLRSATARAARVLDGASDNIRKHEGDLIALQAAADIRRFDHVLLKSVGDPASWSVRVTRTRELLHMAFQDIEDWDPRLEAPVCGDASGKVSRSGSVSTFSMGE